LVALGGFQCTIHTGLNPYLAAFKQNNYLFHIYEILIFESS